MADDFKFHFVDVASIMKGWADRLPTDAMERGVALALFGIAQTLQSELLEMKQLAWKNEREMAQLQDDVRAVKALLDRR